MELKPVKLFAYIDISNPLVEWETAIGRIKSIDSNEDDSFGISLWQFGLIPEYLEKNETQRIRNELILEKIRQCYYPDKVSRLKGLYFFESIEDAKFALQYWDIPLDESCISEVQFYPNSYTKVDSDWITDKIEKDTDVEWMHAYWSGKQKSKEPIYEIIASGTGIILNTELRKKAYKGIFDKYPESTPLLAMACCGFQYRNIENIARIIPGLVSKNSSIYAGYYISVNDLKHHEKELIEAISIAKKNETFPPINKVKNPNIFFKLPDFSKYGFSFDEIDLVSNFELIHKKSHNKGFN